MSTKVKQRQSWTSVFGGLRPNINWAFPTTGFPFLDACRKPGKRTSFENPPPLLDFGNTEQAKNKLKVCQGFWLSQFGGFFLSVSLLNSLKKYPQEQAPSILASWLWSARSVLPVAKERKTGSFLVDSW